MKIFVEDALASLMRASENEFITPGSYVGPQSSFLNAWSMSIDWIRSFEGQSSRHIPIDGSTVIPTALREERWHLI